MNASVIILAIRLATVALATFLAIIVWSKTRDSAWMLVVVGIVAGYADILYSLLAEFGLAPDKGGVVAGVPILAALFPNLPWIFFSIAFFVMIRKRR